MKANRTLLALAPLQLRSASAARTASRPDKYTIYLSNNFVGNDWRQQMIRVAELAVTKPPLADRVELKVENVENTVQAQINSLNNIIRAKPDAILIDAGSDTALNPTIKKACDAGIVVVSFDQVVTEECAYALESDWDRIPAVLAEWMAKTLGGKGKVFVDRGLAGAPISARLQNGYEEVLKKYPDIEVIGYYNGEYALGPEQAGVASLLAAHPEVDGILTQGYGTGAMKALQDAGRPIVPVTALLLQRHGSGLRADRGRQVHPRRQSGLARSGGDQARCRHSRRQQACGPARPRQRRFPDHRPDRVGALSRQRHDAEARDRDRTPSRILRPA